MISKAPLLLWKVTENFHLWFCKWNWILATDMTNFRQGALNPTPSSPPAVWGKGWFPSACCRREEAAQPVTQTHTGSQAASWWTARKGLLQRPPITLEQRKLCLKHKWTCTVPIRERKRFFTPQLCFGKFLCPQTSLPFCYLQSPLSLLVVQPFPSLLALPENGDLFQWDVTGQVSGKHVQRLQSKNSISSTLQICEALMRSWGEAAVCRDSLKMRTPSYSY